MLSQKVSKEACFFILGLSGDADAERLDKTIDEFDLAMTRLLNGAPDVGVIATPNGQVKRRLERAAKAWSAFRNLLDEIRTSAKLDADKKIQLVNLSDQILSEMDLAVLLYAGQ